MTTKKVIFTNQFQLVIEADTWNHLSLLNDKLEGMNLNSYFKRHLHLKWRPNIKQHLEEGLWSLNKTWEKDRCFDFLFNLTCHEVSFEKQPCGGRSSLPGSVSGFNMVQQNEQEFCSHKIHCMVLDLKSLNCVNLNMFIDLSEFHFSYL